MKPTLHGVSKNEALFTAGDQSAIVNTRTLTASVMATETAVADRFWVGTKEPGRIPVWEEIARHALSASDSDVTVVTAGADQRAYTVPKAVIAAAKTGLQTARWDRPGVTAAGRHVASMLTSSPQVTRADVLYLNRFFKRNTEESAGSLRWSLWGGDAGRNWATHSASKMTLTADGTTEVNLLAFYEGDESRRTFWAERDGENALSLYRNDANGGWLSWGNGDWFSCDPPGRLTNSHLVELDDDTAVYVAGALYDAPDTPISLRNLDPEEWDIHANGLKGLDWTMIERVMASGALAAADGKYTPEERSQNAIGQLRDKNGRFAEVGNSGRMPSGMQAEIETLDPLHNTLIVKGSDGNRYNVEAKDFEIDNTPVIPGAKPAGAAAPVGPKLPPLNLKGILGQPRATSTSPKAWMKKLLQPMGAGQLKQAISDYEKFIDTERKKRAKDFPGGNPKFSLGEDDPVVPAPPPVDKKPDPETSDVPPLHLAIVDRDDPQAVTDLVSLVPAEKTGGKATAYRRVAGEWVEDVKIIQDMRSPTPPPVVKLDEATYQDVLAQVDSNLPEDPNAPTQQPAKEPESTPVAPVQAGGDISFEPAAIWGWAEDGSICAITAAGGLDQNRGNAEKLRRYWLYGKGGAKIRWNTGGDWTRCVRYLSKYLGPRAKGYCALRHHEATGMWTGDRRHRQERALAAGGAPMYSNDEIRRMPEVIRASADAARATSARQRVYGGMDPVGPVPQEASDIDGARAGRGFTIPLVIPEGLESGDGRTFDKGALSMRSFPIPLLWQIKTGDGHDGSFVVGRVDSVSRTEDGLGNAYGVFDTGPYGQEAQRLVEQKMLRWVSADLDRFEADEVAANDDLQNPKLRIKKGRLMGITLVAKPAFQECTINLTPLEEVTPVNDGTYVGEPTGEEATSIVASSGISSRIPVEPPKVWFERPVLNGPSPINVTDEGQVFGHIATWDVNHIGLPGATRAPRSASNYAYFHTGVLRTHEGNDVNVGQLTLAGGHASMNADAAAAVKHYDDTGSAICDVHAGEDSYGIWVAGALRPGTTPEQVRALRASAPSGDWRVINGRLELVAVCQVNVPGFPVPRAQVASGAMFALVAAGTQVLARMRQSPMDELGQRIQALEQHELKRDAERREQILSRMAPFKEERAAEREKLEGLAASAQARVFKVLDVDGYLTEFKDFSPEKRKELAEKKHAMKDGSFPIENLADLRRAIHAYGRTSESKQAAVRRHIVRRARALDKPDMIPSGWTETSQNDLSLSRQDSRDVIAAAGLARRAEDIRRRLT